MKDHLGLPGTSKTSRSRRDPKSIYYMLSRSPLACGVLKPHRTLSWLTLKPIRLFITYTCRTS
ncbi:hypothetical protein BC628DRAFT_1352525 [Trametes gibbosa]|nr:hypothetical protein BC628DRAFT_1352525 [Trametes gibbosa]